MFIPRTLGDATADMIASEIPGGTPPAGVSPDVPSNLTITPQIVGTPTPVTPPGVTPDNTLTSILQSVTPLIQSGLTAYGQIQLMNLNSSLIKQGKPPLSSSQVAAMAPQLNVGLAPSTQTMLMYAAFGAGALILLSMAMKPRRRAA